MSEHKTMPADVATAIIKVMAGVRTLGRDDRNQHARYDFVSTDKFLAAVNPLCAEAGLVIIQDEDSIGINTVETADDFGKVKSRTWLTAKYHFTLAAKSGATYGPLVRSVMVQANGAQAFGSAQSYALKQFMRSLFQISTGDKDDADHRPDEELPTRATQARATPQQDTNRPPPTDDAWKADAKRINTALGIARSAAECDDLLADPAMAIIKAASQKTYDALLAKDSQRRAVLDAVPMAAE